ncbi:1-deoxy-D-xylulose-5-phosphate reductoisomerase [Qipengyuania sp. 6B39]|uniref:1-deoxy-D-xylulose-5-phosphate reductoisomerase n=1 Tax=Qipengyuania proteolytica TaxID=2867239 RepID=UPI001C89B7B3|nr:1-deoxy-D-xylulose-5-phosphate reductoisomerase [Qipengyuania proteolytica]
MTRSISILGATGSIGTSTLDLIRRNGDEWRVVALTANCNVAELAALAKEFRAEVAVVADESCLADLRAALDGSGIGAAGGRTALCEAASRPVDLTVAAIVGCAGLGPVMAAIEQGGTIALANKEALVSAGEILKASVEKHGATLLPTDSEHNAIFQCLAGNRIEDVRRVILTASGGPFRTLNAEQLATVTREQALKHPNWDMGAKITIDSATMFNKGLELIEAHHLFPVGLENIEIVVHPQSIIHSMVEYRDGSILAQLGPSDMRVPIASCLAWPQRMETPMAPLDLPAIGRLDFEAPNEQVFPATRLCREAIGEGGAAPAVLNAANEVAVAAFLDRKIPFSRIPVLVERVLSNGELPEAPRTLDEVLRVDEGARHRANELLELA